ncbi:hypothetical protein JL100_018005 [Skermanella mucosa]|uniref:hypothetical protein n=1 Tax=Skermanella mucosa TaxID=1789672 RepID=UPI00192AAC7A|nr:hypothetical protein [Skermanella mucosa]UEM18980.1 hypothetical protein JL100_018005 [Skermanella mucosa]
MSEFKEIWIHGKLAEQFPDSPYRFKVATAHEASWAMEINFPGFHAAIRDQMIEVVLGDKDTGLALDEEEQVHFAVPENQIHFSYAPEGEGSRTGKAILGTLLIVTAAVLFVAVPGTSQYALQLALAGGAMIFGAMTTPPKSDYSAREQDPRKSSLLSGPATQVEEGNSVPLVLGGNEGVLCGGVLISASLDVQQVA